MADPVPDTTQPSFWAFRLGTFPRYDNESFEETRLNIARMLIAMIALWRTWAIFSTVPHYFAWRYGADQLVLGASHQEIHCCIQITLLLFLAVGFLTPLSLMMLLGSYNYSDSVWGTATVGTNVLTLLLIGLLAMNGGRKFSVDAWFMSPERESFFSAFIRKLYLLVGRPSAEYRRLVTFLLVAAYSVMSFGALLFHLQDAYWLNGYTAEVLLTNSYLSRHYELFRQFQAEAPRAFHALSCIGGIGQSIFQLLMLPLVLFRTGRWFVILWGVQFFLISLFFMQLSFLPYLELVFWGMVFWPPRWSAAVEEQVSAEPIPLRHWAVCAYASFVLVLFTCSVVAPRFIRETAGVPRAFFYYHGLDAPHVFNSMDLGMGDHWVTIHRVETAGEVLVPFAGSEGERLSFHDSDVLYFGNSLRWRRRMIGRDPVSSNIPGEPGFDLLADMCRYDHSRRSATGVSRYRIRAFQNRQSAVGLPAEDRFRAAPTFVMDIEVNTEFEVTAALIEDHRRQLSMSSVTQ